MVEANVLYHALMTYENDDVTLSSLAAKRSSFSALVASFGVRSIINLLARRTAMTLIFQYGSNCSESEMNSEARLCGDAKFVGIAETVEDYELAFDVQSTGRGCAASDIVRKAGGKVWGVLYEVPDYLIHRETAKVRNRKSFDQIEGEGTNYKRETIQVRRQNGDIANAQTYTVKNPKPELKTNTDYVGHIVRGLRDHKVPDEYIAKVKAIAVANNADTAKEIQEL
jgi:gamma-glutamylcyclotransferase